MSQQFQNKLMRAAVLALALGTGTSALVAQGTNKVPDFSGFWERKDDVGGGNFGGILEKIIPKASLTPEIIKAIDKLGFVAGCVVAVVAVVFFTLEHVGS